MGTNGYLFLKTKFYGLPRGREIFEFLFSAAEDIVSEEGYGPYQDMIGWLEKFEDEKLLCTMQDLGHNKNLYEAWDIWHRNLEKFLRGLGFACVAFPASIFHESCEKKLRVADACDSLFLTKRKKGEKKTWTCGFSVAFTVLHKSEELSCSSRRRRGKPATFSNICSFI